MKYRRFLSDREGNILLMTGLGILFLFAAGGAAVDFGRQQLVRIKIQQATDAAAIAAAAMPDGTSDSARIATANRYYSLNFPATYLGIARPAANINVTATDVDVQANQDLDTNFIANVGIAKLNASGQTVVNMQAGTSIDYDVIMVIDETYSTNAGINPFLPISPSNPQRIAAMRSALVTLANTIVPPGNTNQNVRIGFMGYSSSVTNKWGLSYQNGDAIAAISNFRPVCNNYDFNGMYIAQNALLGGSGAPNAQVNFPPNYFTYNCSIHTNTAAPNPRTARATAGDANGISNAKNIIFLTDGDIMTDPPPCQDVPGGRPAGPNCYAFPAFRNYAQFLTSCTAAKSTGAHLYVVNFASAPASALTTMRNCASTNTVTGQPDFYDAPNLATLNTVFANITGTIRKIRIAK